MHFIRGDLAQSEVAYLNALDIQEDVFEKDQLAIAFTCVSSLPTTNTRS